MQDQSKANRGLLDELHRLRQRVIELERPKTNPSGDWNPVPEMADHYRAAVDNVTDAIVINVGTTRVFVNNAFLTLHGLDDMSQASGLSLDYFIVPEDKPLVRERTLARENVARGFVTESAMRAARRARAAR